MKLIRKFHVLKHYTTFKLVYEVFVQETNQVIFKSFLCFLEDDEEQLNDKRFKHFDPNLLTDHYYDVIYYYNFENIFKMIPELLTEKWNFEICNVNGFYETLPVNNLVMRIYFENPSIPVIIKLRE